MLSEADKVELDEIVENMREDFEDIRKQNDGDSLNIALGGIEKALERDRYILRRLYELYPECGNRIPLYLATHTGRVAGMNLLASMVQGNPKEVVDTVRFMMMAPMFSALWEGLQKEFIEEELDNL